MIKKMNEFNKTTRNIIVSLVGMFLIFLIFGYFFRDSTFLNSSFGAVTFKVYLFGLLFGIVFSMIKVLLIRYSLQRTLVKSQNKAQLMTMGHFMFRYFLTGLVLYISIINDNMDFFATCLGVIALQPASYFSGYLLKKEGEEISNKVLNIERELDI